MATILGVMSARVQDQYGISATAPVNVSVDDTKTVAQLMTDVATYGTDLAALTQGIVSEATVKLIHTTGADPATASGDVEKGALFNFNNGSDPYAYGVTIPDVNLSILNAQGLVDLTNSSVTAFITFMTTAHTAITVVTKGVRALTSLRDALIAFRKHRKPLERKTKEI